MTNTETADTVRTGPILDTYRAFERIGVCQESWTVPRLLIMQRLLRFGGR